MNDLIRCIDTKTGKEKFMPPNIVKDKKLMASYNMIVQDLKEDKKEVEKIIDPKEAVTGILGDDFEELAKAETPKEKKPKTKTTKTE